MVISVPISNHTLYAFKTTAERYVLVGWSSLALSVNLIGNIIVLLASIRYKAIKLDKVSVTLIENIAVSDMLMGLNTIFPILVSLIADRWVFGDMLCYIQHFLKVPIFVSAELLICAMHISKLTCLAFPLRSIDRKRRTACVLAGTLWAAACIISIAQLVIDRHSVTFDYRLYRCHYVFRAPVWKWARPLLLTCIMVLPNAIVLATTLALLVFVRRKRGKVNLQGALTSLYIGLGYVLAFGPVAINQSIILNLYPTMDRGTREFFFVVFARFAFFMTFLNGMSNVFIYMLSVKSFGKFMKKKILGKLHDGVRRLVAASFSSVRKLGSSSDQTQRIEINHVAQ